MWGGGGLIRRVKNRRRVLFSPVHQRHSHASMQAPTEGLHPLPPEHTLANTIGISPHAPWLVCCLAGRRPPGWYRPCVRTHPSCQAIAHGHTRCPPGPARPSDTRPAHTYEAIQCQSSQPTTPRNSLKSHTQRWHHDLDYNHRTRVPMCLRHRARPGSWAAHRKLPRRCHGRSTGCAAP